MKILLSPAKKMKTDLFSLDPLGPPTFIDQATDILSWLRSRSQEELNALWKCNDKIATQSFDRIAQLTTRLTLTVLASPLSTQTK